MGLHPGGDAMNPIFGDNVLRLSILTKHPTRVRNDETERFVTRRYDNEASFYDLLYNPRDELEYYRRLASHANGPILELACGTGRVTIPLAKAGHEITGLDLSKKMLGRARSKLKQEPAEVRRLVKFIEGDMRTFNLNQKFGLCLIPFFSFQHLLSERDQLRTLSRIRKHLLPRGRFAFNVFNPDLTRAEGLQRLERVVESRSQTIMRYSVQWFDRANQTTHGWLIYEFVGPDGLVKRKISPFKLKYLFLTDVKRLLKKAGFKLQGLYGNYDRSKFSSKSPMMVFITR